MTINYADMFHHIHPGFFEAAHIRALPAKYVFDEQILDLRTFPDDAPAVPAPAHITYGLYTGSIEALHTAVRAVDEDWLQYFQPGDRVYCAFDGETPVSFCLLDDFGEYQGLRIGAPGCVGTVPAWRKMGIGLRMVQLATAS